jgi:hypothetical protein
LRNIGALCVKLRHALRVKISSASFAIPSRALREKKPELAFP